MYQVTIPELRDILFESIFEPTPVGVNKLRKNFGASEGIIEDFKSKKNRVTVGQPYYEPLISRMQAKNEEISHEIKILAEKYDFHFVAMTCVLQPDVNYIIEWARFGVELYAVDSNLGTTHPSNSPPIAYSLFPEDISSEIKVNTKRSITSELKIKASIIEAGIGGSANKDEEYVIYQPQITGYGLNTSKVAWDFNRTQEKSVVGDKKVQLVIQTPKGTKVRGKFILGAQVSSLTSSWWRSVPVSIRKDDAVIAQYNLSE